MDLGKNQSSQIRPSTPFPIKFLLAALIADLGLIPAERVTAQTFTTLHSFMATSGSPATNSDGCGPYAGLILSGNTLYGTAYGGGSSDHGTVFKVNTNGTGFTTLHSFTMGSDGAYPQAGLILSSNTLYGTASGGGSYGSGAVFKVNTNGTGFTNLYSFTARSGSSPYTNSDGAGPEARLILSGNTLYGTAVAGGSSGCGTVFAINTDGTGFTNLHSFTALFKTLTNSDGANPFAGLILSGTTLYGTGRYGGSSGNGTVSAVTTDETSFTTLHSFSGSDGGRPHAGLILTGNTLYGTAYLGGSSDNGTVFSLLLQLPQLTIIHAGANVVLTWPTNSTGYTLQSTTNLVSSAIWANVSPGSVVANGQNTVTNPIFGPQKFFRLSQ
jgi:uncharacterized repeat protein (TIGR03803 family)